MANGWPDEPVEHGYAEPGMDNLKEYLGDPDAVCEFIGDAEIFVTHLAPMSRAMIERLPDLKLIAVSRGGPVNIDMAAAAENNILVVNAPGRNASAVAEFAIGAILAETRRIRAGHESLRRGEWRGDLYRADLAGRELRELTVGVVGYGQTGTRVVRLLKAFDATILVADPYVQLASDDIAAGVKKVDLETLLKESDVVTLHPRVTAETTQMINAETLAQMKPGSLLVNTARGPIVDEGKSPRGLRPSIETTLHSALPQRVVLHVHCVNTIAVAAREDCDSILAENLADFCWISVPYVKPGLTLSRTIQKARGEDTDVIILGNHGLVVAADSVQEAAQLLAAVCWALEQPARALLARDVSALESLCDGTEYPGQSLYVSPCFL